MALYLFQVAYTAEAWANQIKSPRNRIDEVKAMLEGTNVRIRDAWYAFGEYDLVLVVEAPGNVEYASVAIATASGGALKAAKSTPLMSIEDGIEAIRGAGQVGYRPPGTE
ncbi:MAG: GYD domain-containing protein [Chloroflexota bacterium]